MARSGILYSQVAKAAAQLAATGTNPTVDTVRAALGDTGSKSTIGPMLKRWKAEHEGEAVAAGAGLPADLLVAVKGVYQRLEAGVQAQVEQLNAAHNRARQEGMQQLEAESAAGRQVCAERDALSTELVEVKAALAHERDERQHGAVAIAVQRAENDGLIQRLADRAAEVRMLADQLAQSRQQFNHLQEKAAEQRQNDRQGFDVRIGVLEHETKQLRTHLQEQQQAVAVLRVEKQGLQNQVEHATTEATEHLVEVYNLREQLAAANEMASREHMAAAIGAELRHKAEQESVRLDTRNSELLDTVGALKARLEAAARSTRTPAVDKKR